MGTVVEVEGNDEAKLKECGIHNSTSLSSPKQISDPVVYKLVRLPLPYVYLNSQDCSGRIKLHWALAQGSTLLVSLTLAFSLCVLRTEEKTRGLEISASSPL
ncbi:hypothetical protein DKX38_004045 [Salix brachista]|uniref:Uncharacterized protein n=1 Tax=Salix brachista TaxID=2182728 RepID=A0A5N5NBZ5_9ROSI|nr:hypothetical protein DKX38_004045 [Salix brachista]